MPAVIYGKHLEQPLHIAFPMEAAEAILQATAPLMTVNIEGGAQKIVKEVILKKTQIDHLRDDLLHFDFNEVRRGEKLHVIVPLKFIGHPEASELKEGLVEHNLQQIKLECFPHEIPGFIEVDISKLTTGHPIHVRDVKIGPNMRMLNDPESPVIAIVKKGKGAEIEAAVPGEEKAAGEEPEVLTARKPKEDEEGGAAPKAGAPAAKAGAPAAKAGAPAAKPAPKK